MNSSELIWKPHVTVAAVAEDNGCFLLVEERIDGAAVLNQPAGHLEDGEDLLAAVIRETLEETAWHFRPEALVGLYRWRQPKAGSTYLRFTFAGSCTGHEADRPLDTDIERALWLSPGEIRRQENSLRSPMVLRSLEDYLAGHAYPLSLINDVE
jgi:8-oxo-dGTP pyrophosphatase MutT (NUDIX family)